jgi:hypothetical protein
VIFCLCIPVQVAVLARIYHCWCGGIASPIFPLKACKYLFLTNCPTYGALSYFSARSYVFFLRKYFIIGVANYVEITPPDIERKQNKK